MASSASRILLPGVVILASIVVAGLLIATRPENALSPAITHAALVDVARAHVQDLRIPVQAQGTVTAHRDTIVVSEVSGKIVEVAAAFNAGGYLAVDDVLVRVDDRNYRAALLRARASVATAESSLASEKGRAEVARNEWQKLPKNAQRSQDARDLYLRKPQLEQAQALLLSARADLRKAQDDLDRTTIRAPYDALIQEKRSDLGQFVSPGTPIARIFSVDYAEVRLAIPQSKLAYLELPDVIGPQNGEHSAVDLYTDSSGTVTHWPAQLHRTEASLDERSRVLFVIAQVDDPYALQTGQGEALRIGAFVKARILGRELKQLVVLPRYVLRAGDQVWIVDENLQLRNRQVTTLRTEGNEIYVTSGLEQGDLVALTSLQGALPGMAVRINSEVSTRRANAQLFDASEGLVAGQPSAPTPDGSNDTEAQEIDPDQASQVEVDRDASVA